MSLWSFIELDAVLTLTASKTLYYDVTPFMYYVMVRNVYSIWADL